MDAVLQPLNELLQSFDGLLDRMEREIEALQQEPVFSASVLGERSNIETEIRKRVESRNVIERYKKNLVSLIDSERAKYASLSVSDEVARGALRGVKDSMNKVIPQLEEMFSLRLRRENAEADFLRFMLATFDDYRLTEGSISFRTPSNVEKYKALTQATQDAVKEAAAFQERQIDSITTSQAKMREVAPVLTQ